MSHPLATGIESSLRKLELQRAADEQRAVELTAAERYARDPVAWLNDHAVIASKFADAGERTGVYLGSKVRPTKLRLWPNQEQTIAAWIDLDELQRTGEPLFRNVLIEKSRQEGETWVLAGGVDWLLQYHVVTGLYLHQRAAEVADRGWTVKSFFGRVKFIDDRLDRQHVPGLSPLRYMPFSKDPAAIVNTRTGSQVYGEVQRDDPGRGQSLDFAIVDEAAHVQHGEQVHAALDEACKSGKVYVSTPMGDDNVHARLCDARPQGYEYLRLHWSEHPIYGRGVHVAGDRDDCELCAGNRAGVVWTARDPRAHRFPGRLTSPWYDQAVIGKTDEQVASELDIDREGALPARVYSEFSSDVHVVEDGIGFQPELEAKLELAWDYGVDATSIVVCQDAPDAYYVIGIVEVGDLFGTTATPELVAQTLREYLAELGVPRERLTPEWTRRMYAIGDPAGHNRQLATVKPLVNDYRRQGFQIGKPPARLAANVDHGIRAVKRLLLGTPKPLRICGVNAGEFARHMRNHRWPVSPSGHRRPGVTRPLDDIHGHACDAFRYLVVTKWGAPREAEKAGGPEWPEPEPPARRRGPADLERRRDRGVLDPGLGYDMGA